MSCDHAVSLERIEERAPAVRSLFLSAPGKEFRYRPGQRVVCTAASLPAKADFPVASVTSEGFVELCLRASNGGPAEEALCRLKPGDCLHISDAFGDFVIEGPVQTELHFIALGVGVVPIRPMLHAIAESEADPKFTLYHWAETSMDLIFAADFEALGRSCRNFEFTPMLGGSDILRTLLDERCSNTIGSGHEYFVAGAAEMLNMVREKLQSLGHDRERIHQQVC